MMLQNEQELLNAYESMAKLHHLRERCAKEPACEDMREEVADGIEAQMRKIDREIAQYLAEHPRAQAA